MTQTRAFERKQFALEQAIRMRLNDHRTDGSETSDVVALARTFETYLNDESPSPAADRSLAELGDKPLWWDPPWRQSFLTAVTEEIVAGFSWPATAEGVGDFRSVDEFERVIVKGVRGTKALWLSPDGVDSMLVESNAWEIPRGRRIKFEFAEFEDKMLNDVVVKMHEVIIRATSFFDTECRQALRDLLHVGGFDPQLDDIDGVITEAGLWPAAPFRVQTVRWGCLRAKEWTDEGGEHWHFEMQFDIGAAAFLPVP